MEKAQQGMLLAVGHVMIIYAVRTGGGGGGGGGWSSIQKGIFQALAISKVLRMCSTRKYIICSIAHFSSIQG